MTTGRGNVGTSLALVILAALASPVAGPGPRAATSASYVARRAAPSGVAPGAGGVEFVVTGNGPFPARALDPVLHVGKVEVRAYRYVGDHDATLVFTTPDASALEDSAPVTLTYEPGNHDRIDLPALRLDAILP